MTPAWNRVTPKAEFFQENKGLRKAMADRGGQRGSRGINGLARKGDTDAAYTDQRVRTQGDTEREKL